MTTFIQRAFMHALFRVSALTERLRLDTLTCALEAACMHLALLHDEETVWAICARDEQRQGRYGDFEPVDPACVRAERKPATKRKVKPVAKRRE